MAICEYCGKEIPRNFFGAKYYALDQDRQEHQMCKNCLKEADAAGKRFLFDKKNGKLTMVSKDFQIIKRCTLCGCVFSYTFLDDEEKEKQKRKAGAQALAGAAQMMTGSAASGAMLGNTSRQMLSQLKDFTHCPQCGSSDLEQLTREEYEAEKSAAQQPQASVSAADEIKKLKELMDQEIITKEEFEAKKKQLLGL